MDVAQRLLKFCLHGNFYEEFMHVAKKAFPF
jgi:hypothetical protein